MKPSSAASTNWCPLRGSNSRPPDYKSGALPAVLSGLNTYIESNRNSFLVAII